ncbi:alpha/beta hydrolase [Pseudidiomarina marina]|uniref:Proline iminopeptidase n=1 Tax=Pseudidiomarina marina TaxID=502366 RepID=A0A432YFJ2_9GAMM|nr:alpha/beta hydrolase [Pseudidiomarina marina]PHR63587.1 MAG: peptidase [Idiomarina sp.]RUO59714.1 alpha/beta hydrolase [Pseudidiomarina marina]
MRNKGISALALLLGGTLYVGTATAAFAAIQDDTQEAKSALQQQEPLASCYLKNISEQVLCGTLMVPENYEQPDQRQIPINYAVLPAVSENKKADPLLILAGGPGQAATELAAMINRMFNDVRKQRDILLIDQRGTGKSNPLGCELSQVDELVKADDDIELSRIAGECLAQYTEEDLTQYHTVNAIRDFEAVREHLGYQQVNLYGGSYGTRAGLVYMREAPESVRAAVLDAVAPPEVVVGPFGRHGADSFDLLLEQCAGSTACEKTFPSLRSIYAETLTQLEANPVPLTVNDPLTNEPTDILITAGRFTSVMRVGLYHPVTRQLLPFAIQETHRGNYTPLVGLIGSSMSQSEMYMGLTLSVLCSEDLPRATDKLLAQDGDNDFIGSRTADAFIEMCSVWPTAPRPESWFEPVESDIPSLLLSGRLDPVTPPTWGALAAQSLSNSRHLIAPNGSHTIAGHTCANKLAAQFIDTLDLAALDDSCLQQQKPLPFVLNANGKGL